MLCLCKIQLRKSFHKNVSNATRGFFLRNTKWVAARNKLECILNIFCSKSSIISKNLYSPTFLSFHHPV